MEAFIQFKTYVKSVEDAIGEWIHVDIVQHGGPLFSLAVYAPIRARDILGRILICINFR